MSEYGNFNNEDPVVFERKSRLVWAWKQDDMFGSSHAIVDTPVSGLLGTEGRIIKSLQRRSVLKADCYGIFYALAISFFEKDPKDYEESYFRWAEIKANLRKYYLAALSDPKHLRHRLYTHIEMESRWSLQIPGENFVRCGSLLKALSINDDSSDSIVPYSVFQVFADFYDVEVIVFDAKEWKETVVDVDGKSHTFVEMHEKHKAVKECMNRQDYHLELRSNSDPAANPLDIAKPLCYGFQGRRQIFLFSTSGKYGGYIHVGAPSWPICCVHTKYEEPRRMFYQYLIDQGRIRPEELWNKFRTVPYRKPDAKPEDLWNKSRPEKMTADEDEIVKVWKGEDFFPHSLTDAQVEAYEKDLREYGERGCGRAVGS